MDIAPEHLPARRPVWDALADMFLDTDVSPHRAWRAQQLADSPYSIEELERILIDEVYPVCGVNLRIVTGVWSGFDLVWLEQEIRRPRPWWRRLLASVSVGHITMPRFDEWQTTQAGIRELRAGPAHETPPLH